MMNPLVSESDKQQQQQPEVVRNKRKQEQPSRASSPCKTKKLATTPTPSNPDLFYSILGCTEDSTPEQISAEYKAQCLSLHPDKQPTINVQDDGTDNEASKNASRLQWDQLQQAYKVLSDATLRKSYNSWRNAGLDVDFELWNKMEQAGHCIHFGARVTNPNAPKALDDKENTSSAQGEDTSKVSQSANAEGKSEVVSFVKPVKQIDERARIAQVRFRNQATPATNAVDHLTRFRQGFSRF